MARRKQKAVLPQNLVEEWQSSESIVKLEEFYHEDFSFLNFDTMELPVKKRG